MNKMYDNKIIKFTLDFAKSNGSAAGVDINTKDAHIPNFSKCNPYTYDQQKYADLAKKIDHPSGKSLGMVVEIEDKAEVLDADFLNEPEIVDSINGELCCLNKLSFNMPVRKYDPIKHVIPNFSKVLFMPDYFKNSVEQMTYDEDTLKPTNHNQYVIVSGQMAIAGGVETIYCHGYTLVEPVYLTRFKYGGTHSHTNLSSITIQTVGEDYTSYTVSKAQTNLYSVLERELKIAGVKTDEEDTTWYSRVRIMDEDLLKANGIGCNEVFTAATLYDVLIKIGTYLSRVPKLYFNPNYVYGSTDEEEKEFLLYFEPKINRDRRISMADVLNKDAKILGYSESNTQNKNAGTVTCECENVKATNGVWYPAKGQFIAPTGSESEFKVTSSSDYSIKLPCAIEKVNTIKVLKFDRSRGLSGPTTYFTYFKEGKCLEFKEWLTLDETERNQTPYFVEGTNEIQVKHCSSGSNDWPILGTDLEFFYSINYNPKINMKLSSEVSNGYEERINQIDSVLDSKLFGDYIRDYSQANCNCDVYLILMVDNYKDIIPSGTVIEDESNGKKYVVDKVNAIKSQSVYKVYYMLSIDTDKRSEIVGASNLKKIVSIDSDKAYNRLENISERKVLCSLSPSETSSGELNLKYIKKMNVLFENLIKSYETEETYFPSIALCKMSFAKYKHVYDYGDYMSMTEKSPDSKYIWFSLNKTVCGTSLVFNIKSLNNRNMQIGGGLMTWQDTSYNLFHRFTDEFGEIEKISIVLTSFSSEYIDAISSHDNGDGYQQLNVTSDEALDLQKLSVSFNENFPLLTDTSLYDEREQTASIVINNYEILKDTYEKLNITYQIPFTPFDDNSVVNTAFPEMLAEIDFDGENEYSIAVIDPSTSSYVLEREISLNESDLMVNLGIASCEYVEEQNAVEISLNQSYEIASGMILALVKKSNESEGVYNVLIASKYSGEPLETDKVYLLLRTI
mgnify:CR=1 FL=1